MKKISDSEGRSRKVGTKFKERTKWAQVEVPCGNEGCKRGPDGTRAVVRRMRCRLARVKIPFCSVGCRNAVYAEGAKKGVKQKRERVLKVVKDQRGNVMVWSPKHPRARANGYMLECVKVLEQIGVEVGEDERVEHVDGDRENNGILNLRVVKKYSGEAVWPK
jgi:hypothetical protein